MKKSNFPIKMLSLILVLACSISLLIMPASAQGGSFEYGIISTIANNAEGGVKDGVTYLAKGAVVTMRFTLPSGSDVASGEVHIEYDPTKYKAAVDTSVVSVANMSASSIITNPARAYANITDPSVKDNMSSSSNSICQFFYSTDTGRGNTSGGIICDVTFTVIAETAALSPATALNGGFRIVSAMANQDNGTLIGTDIAKNGLNFTSNSTTNAYKLARVPKIQLLMFDYDENQSINSIDLGIFAGLIKGTTTITTADLQISDINGDGIINSTDYTALRVCLTQGESSYVYVGIVI